MQKLFRVFFWGMLISFLGSLPLGTMNVTVTQLSVNHGIKDGFSFTAGSMIVEVIIVRIALVTMKLLAKQHRLFRLLEYITTSVILFLAIASFVAAYKMSGFASPLPIESITPFWSGAFLSFTNPLHIPFWLGWSSVLMNKNILRPSFNQNNWYVIGIGLGTIFGFMVFIYAGNYLVLQIQQHQTLLNCVIGIVLLITATIQVMKIINVPASVRYGKIMRS
ncbi:MAG TPA: LysE family transporter [Chitinophagaceae bacterium]|jgi:threonine/homoserine/homoserine lactone efflux protein|nr:LysE family transporter [Chitinophagaceae bacterium]